MGRLGLHTCGPQEVRHVRDGWDDDQLLTALGEAIRARRPRPVHRGRQECLRLAQHRCRTRAAHLRFQPRRELERYRTVRNCLDPGPDIHLSAFLHRSRAHRGFSARPDRAFAGRNDRGPNRCRRDHDHCGRPARPFLARARTGQPIPLALPHRRRHELGNRLDHTVFALSATPLQLINFASVFKPSRNLTVIP
jgi:hypothetical protein